MKCYMMRMIDNSNEEQRYVKYDKEFKSVLVERLYLSEYKGVKTIFTIDEIKKMASKVKWINWKELEYIERVIAL